MKKDQVLSYVSLKGKFEPPQYEGDYDNVPFTHDEYHEYTDHLVDKLKGVVMNKMTTHYAFENNGEKFILRSHGLGEYVKQLCTKKWHDENFGDYDYSEFDALIEKINKKDKQK